MKICHELTYKGIQANRLPNPVLPRRLLKVWHRNRPSAVDELMTQELALCSRWAFSYMPELRLPYGPLPFIMLKIDGTHKLQQFCREFSNSICIPRIQDFFSFSFLLFFGWWVRREVRQRQRSVPLSIAARKKKIIPPHTLLAPWSWGSEIWLLKTNRG